MNSNSSRQGTQRSSNSPESACILVGISSNAEIAMELLSWTIEVAACPGDTIVALHVLELKDAQAQQYGTVENMTMMRRAKAFVMTILGEFTSIYQTKKVKVQPKVRCSSAIGKGLVDEATSTQAGFLILGRSKKQSLAISTHCYLHAPVSCSVIAVLSRLELPDSVPKASSTSPNIPSGSAFFEAAKLQKMRLKQPENDFGTVDQVSHSLFHGSTLNRNDKDYKNSDEHNRRSSAQSIRTEDDQGGPYGDETNFYGRDAHIPAENFITLGSLLASEPEDSRGTLDQENQSSRWEYSSSSQSFPPSLFDSALEKDGNFLEKFAQCGRDSLKPTWRCFSYDEIFHATNNFHPGNLIGGEHAEVHKGQIHGGQMIAVKRLADQNADEQKQKEFLIELGIMGHVHHPNITCLMGFCIERGLYLIFEFSPNGSLESALHGRKNSPLEWSARFKIALGVARGLHYLHRCCKKRIIHRDIKASNILLGRDFEPQISDFGLAMWLPEQWSHHSVLPLEGTYGCLAPEYFTNGIVDEKTDVYSYGVLLLEIITGRKSVDPSKQNLLFWVKPLVESHNYAALADPKLGSRYDINEMHRLVLAASFCVRESAAQRPSICEVIQIITGLPSSNDESNWRVSESDDDYDDETNGYATDVECRFLRTPYSKIRGY